jgi:hypothetical protein
MDRWDKILLVGAGIAALAYCQFKPDVQDGLVSNVPGWDDLILCSNVTSLDETKTLDLDEDHRAVLNGTPALNAPQNAPPPKVEGTWSFDPTSKQYSITIGGVTNVYSLVNPLSIETCMLIKGSIGAADMRDSWFATRDDPSEGEDHRGF